MLSNPRIIGERSGSLAGPLLLVLTQIHGNEPAGKKAVETLFEIIDLEYNKNKNFDFRGSIVGLIGNLEASNKGFRYIDTDLNRLWSLENVDNIRKNNSKNLNVEEFQLLDLLETINLYISKYQNRQIVILDIHTTTADGGVFIIPSEDNISKKISQHIKAPVLNGFLKDLSGTVLHYFQKSNFPGVDICSICFEAGQHNSPDSIDYALSAIIQCFKSIGGFYSEDVDSKHSQKLSMNHLPKEAELIYSHRINDGDNFSMRGDKIYKNFDKISKGELLAFDKYGEIRSKEDGMILMPLYQKQGNDGFFIIKEC